MIRVLCDFHHSSLLRSLNLLFEERLGMQLYRPIGMDWYSEGYWAINDSEDTAKQFLEPGSPASDGTPPLNEGEHLPEDSIYLVPDPGGHSSHKACTLEFFKNARFDYVIASIPAHVPLFKELIRKYNRHAKLIVQMGNNWQGYDFGDLPVLASVKGPLAHSNNAIFYHQEFDLDVFHDTPVEPNKNIYSFLNIIQNSGIGWEDHNSLKALLEPEGFNFRAYGGQCPDGNMTGAHEMAQKMREAMFIFHVKPGGDGFGHVIHNAYAVGRPIITRASHYQGQLAYDLLVPGTYIDLDRVRIPRVRDELIRLIHNPLELAEMGQRARAQFDKVVDYNNESKEIKTWLESL